MPISVPFYEQKVGTAALPGVRVPNADPLSPAIDRLGQGVSDVAAGFGKLYEKVQQEQDVAAVQDAWTKLSDTKRALLDDKDNGLVAQKGKDALQNSQSYLDNWKAAADEVKAGLTGDGQISAFDNILRRETDSFKDSVATHVAQQSDVLRKQSFEATLAAAKDEAASYAARGEIDKVKMPMVMAMTAVDLEGDAQGWTPAVRDAQKKLIVTDAHLGVLDTLVDAGHTATAKAYLEANRGQMDGSLLAKSNIEKIVTAATIKDEARATADTVWHEADGDPAKAEQILRDKGIKDTALFDEALQRVQQRGSELAAATRQADAPRIGRLEQELLTTGRFNPSTSIDFARLSDEGKGDALRMLKAEQRARRAVGNEERRIQNEIDKAAEADFRSLDLISLDGGTAQDSVDIRNRYPDATQRQRDLLVERQKNVQRAREGARGVAMPAFEAQAKDQAAAKGLKGDKLKSFLSYMKDSYLEWLQDPKNEGKKTPPPEVTRKMIGDALLYGERARSEGFFQPNMYAYEAKQKGVAFTPFAPDGSPAPTPDVVAGPAQAKVIRRTDPKTGETRVWNEATKSWVKE